jgi:hypothetical protein
MSTKSTLKEKNTVAPQSTTPSESETPNSNSTTAIEGDLPIGSASIRKRLGATHTPPDVETGTTSDSPTHEAASNVVSPLQDPRENLRAFSITDRVRVALVKLRDYIDESPMLFSLGGLLPALGYCIRFAISAAIDFVLGDATPRAPRPMNQESDAVATQSSNMGETHPHKDEKPIVCEFTTARERDSRAGDPIEIAMREYSDAIRHRKEREEEQTQACQEREKRDRLEEIKRLLHDIDGRCGHLPHNPGVAAIIASLGSPYDSVQAAISQVMQLQEKEEEQRRFQLELEEKE